MVYRSSEQNDTQLVELFECQHNATKAWIASQYPLYITHLHLIIFKFLSSYSHKHHHILHHSSYECTYDIRQFYQAIDQRLAELQIKVLFIYRVH